MTRSWKRSSVWAISALLLATSVSHAEPDETVHGSRLLDFQGQKGLWFPMASGRKLLGDVASLPKVRAQLGLLEVRLKVQKDRTKLLEQNVDTTERMAKTWKETAESQAELLAKRRSALHSPYLWAAISFIAGVASTIAIVYLARDARSEP